MMLIIYCLNYHIQMLMSVPSTMEGVLALVSISLVDINASVQVGMHSLMERIVQVNLCLQAWSFLMTKFTI